MTEMYKMQIQAIIIFPFPVDQIDRLGQRWAVDLLPRIQVQGIKCLFFTNLFFKSVNVLI